MMDQDLEIHFDNFSKFVIKDLYKVWDFTKLEKLL